MSVATELLWARCDEVLLGTSLVLACAYFLALRMSEPIHRQRILEFGIFAAVPTFLLLLLPLPKILDSWVIAQDVPGSIALFLADTAPIEPATSSVFEQTQESKQANAARSSRPHEGPWKAPLILGVLFLIGALGVILQLLGSSLILMRLARKSRPVTSEIRRLADSLGLQKVAVLSNLRSIRPFCFGIRNPVVVLPQEWITTATRAQLEAVLLHEMAHLDLRHLHMRRLCAWAAVPLYWNPLFWVLLREQRLCAELLADDVAAAKLGKRAYVRQLVNLAENLHHFPRTAFLHTFSVFGVLQLLGKGKKEAVEGPFYQRMKCLLLRKSRLKTNSTRIRITVNAIAALFLVSTTTLAWGHVPNNQEPFQESSSRQNPVLESRFTEPYPSSMPTIRARFHAQNTQALGEWLAKLADNKLLVSSLEVQFESGRPRDCHLVVQGSRVAVLVLETSTEVRGLNLSEIHEISAGALADLVNKERKPQPKSNENWFGKLPTLAFQFSYHQSLQALHARKAQLLGELDKVQKEIHKLDPNGSFDNSEMSTEGGR